MNPRIIITGLGPAGLGQLTLETWEALQRYPRIILRTGCHPAAMELEARGIQFETCDRFYEEALDFQQVYSNICDYLLEQAQKLGAEADGTLLYCVPGHPLVAEASVQRLLQAGAGQGVRVEVLSAMSFLDPVFTALALDPTKDGFAVLDALALPKVLPLGCGCLYTQVYSRLVASDLKLILLEHYPAEQPVTLVFHAGQKEQGVYQRPLAELDYEKNFDHLTSVYVPPLPGCMDSSTENRSGSQEPCHYPLDPLVQVFQRLLAPDGCPWDRAQTHASLKQYLLEETYEVLEAIDLGDQELLQEELGDVLMQVVFHGTLAQAGGAFDCNDIVAGITSKLIRRHPHVFGQAHAQDVEGVQVLWAQIKDEEKEKRKNLPGGQANRPLYQGLPALQMAVAMEKLQKKPGGQKITQEAAIGSLTQNWEKLQKSFRSDTLQAADLGQVLYELAALAGTKGLSAEAALISFIQKMNRKLP